MARSYEEQKHQSRVGASLLAIATPAESEDRGHGPLQFAARQRGAWTTGDLLQQRSLALSQ